MPINHRDWKSYKPINDEQATVILHSSPIYTLVKGNGPPIIILRVRQIIIRIQIQYIIQQQQHKDDDDDDDAVLIMLDPIIMLYWDLLLQMILFTNDFNSLTNYVCWRLWVDHENTQKYKLKNESNENDNDNVVRHGSPYSSQKDGDGNGWLCYYLSTNILLILSLSIHTGINKCNIEKCTRLLCPAGRRPPYHTWSQPIIFFHKW